jgi:biopolymer transport protein ExbD
MPLLEGLAGLATMALVLVAFFLVRGSFTVRGGVDLVGPESALGENREDPIVIRVSSAGTVHFNGKRLDLPVLRKTVDDARFESPHAPLLVLAEQGAHAGLLARVVDQCKLTGASDIRFTLLED